MLVFVFADAFEIDTLRLFARLSSINVNHTGQRVQTDDVGAESNGLKLKLLACVPTSRQVFLIAFPPRTALLLFTELG